MDPPRDRAQGPRESFALGRQRHRVEATTGGQRYIQRDLTPSSTRTKRRQIHLQASAAIAQLRGQLHRDVADAAEVVGRQLGAFQRLLDLGGCAGGDPILFP